LSSQQSIAPQLLSGIPTPVKVEIACHTLSTFFLKLASSMDYNHDVTNAPIKQNITKLLAELPNGVDEVAAAKAKTPE